MMMMRLGDGSREQDDAQDLGPRVEIDGQPGEKILRVFAERRTELATGLRGPLRGPGGGEGWWGGGGRAALTGGADGMALTRRR